MTIFLCMLLMSILNSSVYAANLSITPTNIVLHPQRSTAALTFTNNGAKPVTLQIFFKSWVENKGNRKLTNSREVVVFPKMLKIAPGKERPIRVGFRGRWPKIERAFRIFADELPNIDIKSGTGVVFPVRLSIPLFVRNQAADLPIDVTIVKAALHDGRLRLNIRNNAAQHIAINQIYANLYNRRGRSLRQQTEGGGRVLAKSQAYFYLPVPKAICRQARTVNIRLKLQQTELKRRFNLNVRGCKRSR